MYNMQSTNFNPQETILMFQNFKWRLCTLKFILGPVFVILFLNFNLDHILINIILKFYCTKILIRSSILNAKENIDFQI